MATSGTLRPLNSLGGFSVGDNPQDTVILANGDITAHNISANGNLSANYANFSGNLAISNTNANWGVLTDNLYYSNGVPWDMSNPAGSNNYIQYNDNGSFGASANFQFDPATSILDVTGTANITGNAKVTNTLTANTANITLVLNGNVGNFSGNLSAANANLGTGLLIAGNANISDTINGNIANFSGNLTSLNANLGNLAIANFVNVASNIQTANLGITGVVTGNFIPATTNTYTLGNSTSSWKDLYLSGTSIYLGAQQITSNAAGINLSNNVVVANTLTAANIVDTNLSNTQIVFANGTNTFVGSANFVFDATASTLSVDNANLIGTLNGNVANFTGNLTSLNASLGNLATANYVNVSANLVVSGNANFTGAANVSLGAVGNLHITGGSNGQVLQTDGSGNLTWSSTANINEIMNGTSNVYIPTANGNITITANGSQTWTFGTDGKLSTAGDIQANGTVNANAITASTSITSSGNIYANTGYVYANYANVTTDLYVGANANIVDTLTANVANITTINVANIGTTGNITANNVTVNSFLSGNTANFSGQVYLNNSANVTGNLGVSGNITTGGSGGNITMSGGNINGVNALFANTANISLQLNGANANFTGNVTAANFIGTLANGTSNVEVALNGNVTINPGTFGGNAYVFADHVLETAANITATGNIQSNGSIIANTFVAYADTGVSIQAGPNSDPANISLDVSLVPSGGGTVAVSGARITNLAEPTGDQDAATKYYVDQVAQGLNIHDSALAATTNTLTILTGGTITYNDGPNPLSPGVGANLVLSGSPTANFLSANVFDGNVTAVVSSRILVKSETNQAYNGIYVVDSATVLTRSADFNTVPEIEPGDFIFVQDGTTYNDSGWVQTAVVVTVGTSPIIFTQFSGAGSYTANTAAGLVLNGSVFSAKVDGNAHPTTAFDAQGNIYIPASAWLTTPNIGAATGTSVSLETSLTANYVNANVSFNTLGDINATTGNITGNYVFVNQDLSVTGNIANANNISVTNNITAGSANVTLNLQGNTANFIGNLTAANANLGTGLLIAGNANIATTLNGNIANFSGNLTSLNANLGNLATANYVNVANDLNVTGTSNLANVSLTGNITANNITSNNRVSATNIKIGNSYIYSNTVTTTSTSPATICSFLIAGTDVYGVEYIVKSYDASGKYSMATVQAVTNGVNVDYVTFATVRLGTTTGALSVDIGGTVGPTTSIDLVATPSTSNSTVWTTQYRLI
jgi:hypothetical protein